MVAATALGITLPACAAAPVQPTDEQILVATEDLFLLESDIHTTLFDDTEVQTEIRRAGVEMACPVLHRSIRAAAKQAAGTFRPILIASAKNAIPASQLGNGDAWGLYSPPISPYRERLIYFVERDAGPLLLKARADATTTFLDQARALPAISQSEWQSDPRHRDMTLGIQFAGACKSEMMGKPDEVKSARALKEQRS
ncbi:MAG: hypothetical protein LCH74_17235 [Proteobacteria bacterium]|nr:hypothetical protein [Pseudomonadota bacterium]